MQYQQPPGDRAAQFPAAFVDLSESEVDQLPDGFVYLDEVLPGIDWDARYAGPGNFTGDVVDGYAANRIAMAVEMVEPLRAARDLAREMGYGLLVWDAARPQRAVDNFVRWAEAPEDGLTKDAHYPNIRKRDMFNLGYVAKRSGHSRGAAIDLTLIDDETGEPLDMGTGFDFMDELSHHGAKGLTGAQTDNRRTLASIMADAGFKRYDNEWWHYSLIKDPHPDEYFDFEIEE